MSLPDPAATGNSDIHQAAWNAVVVASFDWQQSRRSLAYILSRAAEHGLSTAEMHDASGLPVGMIRELIAEAR